jgi:hypothetical protein
MQSSVTLPVLINTVYSRDEKKAKQQHTLELSTYHSWKVPKGRSEDIKKL